MSGCIVFFRSTLFASLLLLLSGCNQHEKTAAYYLVHPEEIQPTYDRCVSFNNDLRNQSSKECIAVLEAIPTFRANLSELMDNAGFFGLNLMRAEIRLVELQKAYNQAVKLSDPNIHRIKREIELQNVEVQSRLALLRLLFRLRS